MIRLAIAAAILPVACQVQAVDCNKVGPTYCPDTPAYRAALTQKKSAAGKEYPGRLVALYDKLDHCEAAVTTAPDGFRVLRVLPNGDWKSDGWTQENEDIDAKQVVAKTLKACYVVLSQHAFFCDTSKDFRKQPDYDEKLDLNKSMTLPCQ